MIVRLSRGLLLEDSINVSYPGDNGTESMWQLEDECIQKPNDTFYREFAAITNLCHLAWENEEPFWFRVQCNEDEFLLQKFSKYGCPNDSEITTDGWPNYRPSGCDDRKWNDKYWYSTVTICTHPKYNLGGVGQKHINISLFFIISMVIYMII